MTQRIYVETSRDRVATVARRWREQYSDAPTNPHFKDILSQLEALDTDTATPEDVEKIIGNSSWTREYCGVCATAASTWVRLGDEPDYDSNSFIICTGCLRDANAIAKVRETQ